MTHVHRTELSRRPAEAGRPVAVLAHLSDLHVCDSQSPARVEFLDRWADPDSPIHDVVGEVGTYRPQEILTTQVLAATVTAVNQTAVGPSTGRGLDAAIVTGDNTDNAQANELANYLHLLEGGQVHPDSGDPSRYEGVAAADWPDPDGRYWHPETHRGDRPQREHGLPYIPGLLAAARRGWDAPGLRIPWLAVHGNHDQLLQGTIVAEGAFATAAVAASKAVGLRDEPSEQQVLRWLGELTACDPQALRQLGHTLQHPVAPDPGRRVITREEFVAAHFGPRARPNGHGFTGDQLPYYRHDIGELTILTLNTVNEYGGWQGCLDREQFGWLRSELRAADRDRRLVVLASHHPLSTLINGTGPQPPVLADELLAELSDHPGLIAWLNGHTHATTITMHPTFWEITTPSLIDWPQQWRLVEFTRAAGVVSIVTTMQDHAGSSPWSGATDGLIELAGLSRQLAGSAWQNPEATRARSGTELDRDVVLHVPDPWE